MVDPDNKHKQRHSFKCTLESLDLDYSTSPLAIDAQNNLVVADGSKLNFEFIPFLNIRVSLSFWSKVINQFNLNNVFVTTNVFDLQLDRQVCHRGTYQVSS